MPRTRRPRGRTPGGLPLVTRSAADRVGTSTPQANAGPATGFTKAGAAVNVPSPLPHSSGRSSARPTAASFGEGTWYNTDLSRLDLSDGFTWTNGVGGGSLIALPATYTSKTTTCTA